MIHTLHPVFMSYILRTLKSFCKQSKYIEFLYPTISENTLYDLSFEFNSKNPFSIVFKTKEYRESDPDTAVKLQGKSMFPAFNKNIFYSASDRTPKREEYFLVTILAGEEELPENSSKQERIYQECIAKLQRIFLQEISQDLLKNCIFVKEGYVTKFTLTVNNLNLSKKPVLMTRALDIDTLEKTVAYNLNICTSDLSDYIVNMFVNINMLGYVVVTFDSEKIEPKIVIEYLNALKQHLNEYMCISVN